MGGSKKNSLLNGLLAYWKLDEASGNALDISGNNYTLTQSGNPLGVVGKVGNARQLVAASSQFLYNDTFKFSDTDFTISLWVNITTMTNYVHICSNWSALNQGQFVTYIDTNKVSFGLYSDSGIIGSLVQHTDFGNLSVDTWYHAVFTRDKTNGKIKNYINTVGTEATANGVIGTSQKFRLGARETGASGFLNGIVDEVGIWDRILTTEEIGRLYNA